MGLGIGVALGIGIGMLLMIFIGEGQLKVKQNINPLVRQFRKDRNGKLSRRHTEQTRATDHSLRFIKPRLAVCSQSSTIWKGMRQNYHLTAG